MKRILFHATLLTLSLSLTSCASLTESMLAGIFGGDDEERDYYESREKRERRSQYRTQGKPTLSFD